MRVLPVLQERVQCLGDSRSIAGDHEHRDLFLGSLVLLGARSGLLVKVLELLLGLAHGGPCGGGGIVTLALPAPPPLRPERLQLLLQLPVLAHLLLEQSLQLRQAALQVPAPGRQGRRAPVSPAAEVEPCGPGCLAHFSRFPSRSPLVAILRAVEVEEVGDGHPRQEHQGAKHEEAALAHGVRTTWDHLSGTERGQSGPWSTDTPCWPGGYSQGQERREKSQEGTCTYCSAAANLVALPGRS